MASTILMAAVVVGGVMLSGFLILFACVAVLFAIVALLAFFKPKLIVVVEKPLALARIKQNPILGPNEDHPWENEAVFNPAAFTHDGRVHLLYRAMGSDGISRIGYASSADGINFDERFPYPVYAPTRDFGIPNRMYMKGKPSYDPVLYASGGGWGGCEDPRISCIEDNLYMTFTAFDGWGFVRMAVTSLHLDDFAEKLWNWKKPALLSPPNEIQKNWVLFPEKINDSYAILHSITPKISIEYVKNLEEFDGTKFITGSVRAGGREGHWDSVVRGAGAPPIKTKDGWLLLYHGYDGNADVGYRVGAMLLDLTDPSKVLYRTANPILEPTEWYENEWKAGVIIATGAVVVGDTLFVYYGGGDKRIAVATANLTEFLHKLTTNEHAVLKPQGILTT